MLTLRGEKNVMNSLCFHERFGGDVASLSTVKVKVEVNVKVKLSLCFLTKHLAMKAYWGSGCIAPLIL
jgi:hypothetical protein